MSEEGLSVKEAIVKPISRALEKRFLDELIAPFIISYFVFNYEIFFYLFGGDLGVHDRISLVNNFINRSIDSRVSWIPNFYPGWMIPLILTVIFLFVWPEVTQKLREHIKRNALNKEKSLNDITPDGTRSEKKIAKLELELADLKVANAREMQLVAELKLENNELHEQKDKIAFATKKQVTAEMLPPLVALAIYSKKCIKGKIPLNVGEVKILGKAYLALQSFSQHGNRSYVENLKKLSHSLTILEGDAGLVETTSGLRKTRIVPLPDLHKLETSYEPSDT